MSAKDQSFSIDDFQIRKYNSSEIYIKGSIWYTKEGETLIVIGQSEKYSVKYNKNGKSYKNYRHFIVKFPEGHYGEFIATHIKSKKIKNCMFPSVCAKGCVGIGIWKTSINGEHTKEYRLWKDMLKRCYSEKYQIKTPTYRGCSVSERWLNFQNFCEDIQLLCNYTLWKNSKESYHLDKDLKIKGNKQYNLETCQFIPEGINVVNSNLTGKTYIGVRLSDGYTEAFVSQRGFCRIHGLTPSGLREVLKGNQYAHKGWTFWIKE
jgi:hypothetical protein